MTQGTSPVLVPPLTLHIDLSQAHILPVVKAQLAAKAVSLIRSSVSSVDGRLSASMLALPAPQTASPVPHPVAPLAISLTLLSPIQLGLVVS